jgi:hypothetical protein
MLDILEEIWVNYFPDYRFFQFMAILPTTLALPADAFYVEDDLTLERLTNFLAGLDLHSSL